MKSYRALHIIETATAVNKEAGLPRIIRQRVAERSGIVATSGDERHDSTSCRLYLDIRADIGAEGYAIEEAGDGVRIIGNDRCGLLAGVGRFLHYATYAEGELTPAPWRGVSLPECAVRGMYFALHENWYSYASRPEVSRYIEDLGLWGLNTIAFHLPQFIDPSSPEALAKRDEFRGLLLGARNAAGMKVALFKEPNIGMGDAPEALLAAPSPDTTPPRRGNGGIRVCPSQPEGFAYLSRMLAAYLESYRDIGLD